MIWSLPYICIIFSHSLSTLIYPISVSSPSFWAYPAHCPECTPPSFFYSLLCIYFQAQLEYHFFCWFPSSFPGLSSHLTRLYPLPSLNLQGIHPCICKSQILYHNPTAAILSLDCELPGGRHSFISINLEPPSSIALQWTLTKSQQGTGDQHL